MKLSLLGLIVAMAAVSTVPAFAAGSSDAGPLAATMEAWKQAMIHKDAGALDKLYHKDLAYTHSSGKTESKAEAIAAVVKAPPTAIEFHNLTTHVYGNVATVKSQVDYTGATAPMSHLDILMVWVKSGADWQLVSRQAVKLP